MTVQKSQVVADIARLLAVSNAALSTLQIDGEVTEGGIGNDLLMTVRDLNHRLFDFMLDPANLEKIQYTGGRLPVATTNYQRTKNWLIAAGKKVSISDSSVQYGVHLEEVAESIDCVSMLSMSGVTGVLANEASRLLKAVGEDLKLRRAHMVVWDDDRGAFLDALSDTSVTCDGTAFLMGFDKDGHDMNVLSKNDDKFNADGTPVIKEGGKVGKRDGWTPPDPTPFVGSMPSEPRPSVEPLSPDADFEEIVHYFGSHFKSAEPDIIADAMQAVLQNVADQTARLNVQMNALAATAASSAPANEDEPASGS